jgi:hypothetical protein
MIDIHQNKLNKASTTYRWFSIRFWNYYDGVTCYVIVLICFAFVNIEFLYIINVIIINTEALL